MGKFSMVNMIKELETYDYIGKYNCEALVLLLFY